MQKFFSKSSRKTLSSQMHSGTILLLISITLVFLFLSFFALSYHNKNATNGYQLKVLREEREKLMFEIETEEMKIADLSAINKKKTDENFEEEVEEKNYITKIIYLQGKSSQ